MLAARRQDVPPGQFNITAMGAVHPQDVRRAAPADACRDRRGVARPAGVPLPGRRWAGAHQHSGKTFFESATAPLAGPVTVGADGTIAGGNPNMANRALYHT